MKGNYVVTPLDQSSHEALKPGKNLLTVHRCQKGGQYMDAHIIDVVATKKKTRGAFCETFGLPAVYSGYWARSAAEA